MKYSILLLGCLIFITKLYSQYIEKNNFQFSNGRYDVFILKIDSTLSKRFKVLENVKSQNEKQLFDDLSGKGIFFAVNAGIVDSACNLLGLFINNSNKIQDVNLNSGVGNFFLQPNGIIGFGEKGITLKKAIDYAQSENYLCAVQSGPMLVSNKSINANFDKNSKNKNFRVGAGIYSDNLNQYLVFAISISKVTFHQFASLFLEKFNCNNALNIESGSLCTFHQPSSKRTFNNTLVSCKYLFLQLQ